MNPYYFRSSDGHELDLVLDFGTKGLWGIGIKLSSNIGGSDAERVKTVSHMIKAEKQFLICQAKEGMWNGSFGFGNMAEFMRIVEGEI